MLCAQCAQREELAQQCEGMQGPNPGDLPPAGVFPATMAALGNFTHAQVTALATYYGVDLGQQPAATLPVRRAAAKAFIQG